MLKLDMSRRTALPNLNQNCTHDLIKGTMSLSSLSFLCPLPANIGVDVKLGGLGGGSIGRNDAQVFLGLPA